MVLLLRGRFLTEATNPREEEFGLEIPDSEAARMITVGDLQAFIVVELRRLGRPEMDSAAVFERFEIQTASRTSHVAPR